ncbi:LuxR family transcriptional regulator [Gordonia spumicola]|uniref:LuxR family transcriptional regulator n=1 Tax=Gordonia spumicola TaxID=589161 RepID=A0A7I9VAF8_9ACTN|nr:LuxR C-terminal-related transcriptional regulator [Gordonia spumicola]GEE02327.1 LuxR family transcriptional regulator [Gordonia spumicola]
MKWPYQRTSDFDAVARGWAEGRPVLITGPSGIGKTRLSREFVDSVGRRPFWIIGSAAMRDTPLAAVAAAVPVDASGGVAATVDSLRAALSDDVVVIVEAAEHLDSASSAVVARLVSSIARPGLITAAGAVDPVLARALRDASAVEVRVAALGLEATTDLIESSLDGRLAVDDAVRIHRLTGGNPLMVTEAFDSAIASGAVVRCDDAVWRLDADPAISAGLRQVCADRLMRATPAERRLVDLLALCQPLPYEVVDRLGLAGGVGRAEGGLALPMGDVVVPGHAVYPEVRRAQIGQLERRQLAEQLVEALDAMDGGSIVRLHAVRLRQEYGLETDVDALTACSATAFQMGDLVLAERLSSVAVESGGGLGARLQLSRARSASGRSSEAREVLRDVDQDSLGEADVAGYAVTVAINRSVGDGDHSGAIGVLDKFEPRIEAAAFRASFAAVRALVHVNAGDQFRALRCARTARGIPEGAPLWTTVGAYVEAEALRRSGESRRAIVIADAALSEGGAAASFVVSGARRTLVQALICDADLPRAVLVADRLLDETLLQSTPRALACASAAMVDMARGRFGAARHQCHDALRVLGTADRTGLGRGTAAQLAEICAVTGDAEGGRRAVALSATATVEPHGWPGINPRLAAAFVLVAEGEVARPARMFREIAATCLAADQRVSAIAALYWGVRLGDAESAHALVDAAELCDGALIGMQRDHATATIDRAPDDLERVAERFGDAGFLPFAVDAVSQAIVVHRARGEVRSVRRLVDRRETWRSGCDPMTTPAVRDSQSVAVLTRREFEAHAMASVGLTVADIAVRLGVRERTVRSVLHTAYEKSGVPRSR